MSKGNQVEARKLRLTGAGYITQMLRELADMAKAKDPTLLYFIEMAMRHSHDLDIKEMEAREEKYNCEAA